MSFSYFYILQRQWIWDVNSIFSPVKLMVLFKLCALSPVRADQLTVKFVLPVGANGTDHDTQWCRMRLSFEEPSVPCCNHWPRKLSVKNILTIQTTSSQFFPAQWCLRTSLVHILWSEQSTILCLTEAALAENLQNNISTSLHRNESIHPSYIQNLQTQLVLLNIVQRISIVRYYKKELLNISTFTFPSVKQQKQSRGEKNLHEL